jgi:ABC-type antimicrobial peptide transport system permease subunit
LIKVQKNIFSTLLKHFLSSVKAITIFLINLVMYYFLGNSDTQTIALIVFLIAVIMFSAAFLTAKVKDRIQRRKVSHYTVYNS